MSTVHGPRTPAPARCPTRPIWARVVQTCHHRAEGDDLVTGARRKSQRQLSTQVTLQRTGQSGGPPALATLGAQQQHARVAADVALLVGPLGHVQRVPTRPRPTCPQVGRVHEGDGWQIDRERVVPDWGTSHVMPRRAAGGGRGGSVPRCGVGCSDQVLALERSAECKRARGASGDAVLSGRASCEDLHSGRDDSGCRRARRSRGYAGHVELPDEPRRRDVAHLRCSD